MIGSALRVSIKRKCHAGMANTEGLTSPVLESIPVPNVPLPLQENFAAIVQKFERIRKQLRKATRQAEHLFQTALNRAFRGAL